MPALENQADLDRLAESGYRIKLFSRIGDYKTQRDILRKVKTGLGSSASQLEMSGGLAENLQKVGRLVLDGLFAPSSGLGVCERNPQEEYSRLASLGLESLTRGEELFLVAPVCPDYLQGKQYKLGGGVGYVAAKLLNRLESVQELFGKNGMKMRMQIHMADVESGDQEILRASGESRESFLAKTNQSMLAIASEVEKRGLENVEVVSMIEAFDRFGINYYEMQSVKAEQIKIDGSKKVRKVLEGLTTERTKNGDVFGIDGQTLMSMISSELGGYAAYGELVDGNAVIVSADAMSAVPAYNFFRNGRNFNPVIQIRS